MQTSRMRTLLPWLLGAVAGYYLIPSLSTFLPGDWAFPVMLLWLVIWNPVYCFLSGIAVTMRLGFCWYYALLAAVLFVPVFPVLLETEPQPLYVLIYGAAALLGSGVAVLARKLRKK